MAQNVDEMDEDGMASGCSIPLDDDGTDQVDISSLVVEIEERLRREQRDKLRIQMDDLKRLLRAELEGQAEAVDGRVPPSSLADHDGEAATLVVTPEEVEQLEFGGDLDRWVKLAVRLQNALDEAEARWGQAEERLEVEEMERRELENIIKSLEDRVEALHRERELVRAHRWSPGAVNAREGGMPSPIGDYTRRLEDREREIARLCNENRRQRIELVHALSLLLSSHSVCGGSALTRPVPGCRRRRTGRSARPTSS